MKKAELQGKKYYRLEVLMRAWVDEKGQQLWMCICDCLNVRFMTTGQLQSCNRKSCGCLRRESSYTRTTAMNYARAGQPRSQKGKLASQAACRKMNSVRHLKARHIIENIDVVALSADCRVCGRVPLKVMKHKANGLLRDQYLCWVGSLRVNNAYAKAKVRYPGHAFAMFEAQEGKCAICHGFMIRANGLANDGMVLDHCHTTTFIRGFVHQRCNKGLGIFKDDTTHLRQAADYLDRVKELELKLAAPAAEMKGY